MALRRNARAAGGRILARAGRCRDGAASTSLARRFERGSRAGRDQDWRERGGQAGGCAARFADEGVTQCGLGGGLWGGEGDRYFLDAGGEGGEGVFDEGFVVFKFLLDGS